MTAVFIDESLLEPRPVLRHASSDDGMGYEADLACGHSVWIAIPPPRELYCGLCLDKLIHQLREVQAHQQPRG